MADSPSSSPEPEDHCTITNNSTTGIISSSNKSQTPYRRHSEDFFDTAPSHSVITNTSSTRNIHSDRFVFDGDDDKDGAVIVAPHSPTSPPYPSSSSSLYCQYSNAGMTEPLLQQYDHRSSLPPSQPLLEGDQLQHMDDRDDQWSLEHPFSLPFTRPRRHRTSELSGLNILNFTTFLGTAAVLIVIGSGVVKHALQRHNHDWLPSTWEVTTLPAYETLLTPAQWAGDYLWIPVLSLEGMFAFIQLLPQVRSRAMVVTGIGYMWFYIGICQSITTVFFSLKWIIPAWFLLLLTVLCLVVLQLQQQLQYTCPSSNVTRWEYWVFRFPFDVHLGWLLPLLAARGSMIFRRYGTHDVGLQLAADIVAVALLLPCAGAYLYRAQGPPDWVVPLMILWAYIGIACRLLHPPETLANTYEPDIIDAVRDSAWCFAGTVGVLTIPQIVVWVAREFLTIHVVQLNDDDGGDANADELVFEDPRESVAFANEDLNIGGLF